MVDDDCFNLFCQTRRIRGGATVMTRPYGPDDSHRVVDSELSAQTPRVNVATDDSVAAIALFTEREDEWLRSDTTVADMGIPQQ